MTTPARILVVDDDEAVSFTLASVLEQAGYTAFRASSGTEALERLAGEWFDLVITDVRMPGMDGIALMTAARETGHAVPFVVATAHGTKEVAVDALRAGASDFLEKPLDRAEVLAVVERALGHPPAPTEASPTAGGPILGDSEAIRAVLRLADRAAQSHARVLLLGESGTGKELVARRIHERSPRAEGPLVAVNCAALPEALIESELFGYEEGAFTGAIKGRPGRVELAMGGTLFLDEIGDLSPSVQAKLLRFLELGTFERLGSGVAHTSDARVVTATSRDLEAMVEDGSFREDLFFRLEVLTIHLPPLRERGNDVRVLARAFFEQCRRQERRESLVLLDEALDALVDLPWPGNVRELRNFMERLVVFADGTRVDASEVALHRRPRESLPAVISDSIGDASTQLDATRRRMIEDALSRTRGNRSQAARILGISRRTLYRWLGE
ncbi:MAG: sigma-54 dependent transcriptional regulator [Myxococcota bacterium]